MQTYHVHRYVFSTDPSLVPLTDDASFTDDYGDLVRLAGQDPDDDEIVISALAEDWSGHKRGDLAVHGLTITGYPLVVLSPVRGQKLRTLTATAETVARQRDDDERAALPKVAARLWAAWRHCFPSCETLTEAPDNWCLLSRSALDDKLYLHRSQQVDESWTHPDPMPGSATVARHETAWRTTVRVEIRTATQARLFAVTFEEHPDAGRRPHTGRDAYTLTKVEVDFGADGSFDRASALAGWYLWPSANGTDGETYEAHELPLLWSAAPEFDQVYVPGAAQEAA